MAKPPELVRPVRVVVVSPSDVMVERGLLERVVDELNRTTAPSHGCGVGPDPVLTVLRS